MKTIHFYFLIMVMVMVSPSCKKPGKENKIDISGFQLIDQFGNYMGRVGPADNDWTFLPWTSLSSFEQSLLNTADGTGLENTVVCNVVFATYPNPVQYSSAVSVSATDSVKFTLVVVDESGTIIHHWSKKFRGSYSVQMDVSNRAVYPSKKSLRYYYSFSAQGQPHFKLGYGDIKVCDGTAGQDLIENCFR